jgi:hypothetical protein
MLRGFRFPGPDPYRMIAAASSINDSLSRHDFALTALQAFQVSHGCSPYIIVIEIRAGQSRLSLSDLGK